MDKRGIVDRSTTEGGESGASSVDSLASGAGQLHPSQSIVHLVRASSRGFITLLFPPLVRIIFCIFEGEILSMFFCRERWMDYPK